jgi:hypothetical protein
VSPKYCHIIKRSEIWQILEPHMKNTHIYKLIKYCMFYSMYILKQEETIMFSQVCDKYRVIFTLDEANKWPTFNKSHIELNPYILQLTGDTNLSRI